MELDRVDRTLLELLQHDGRMSAQALSEAVNLSARATLNRVRRLEEEGLIEGYRACCTARRWVSMCQCLPRLR